MSDPKPKPKKPKTRTPPPRSTVVFGQAYEGADALPKVAAADQIAAHDGELVRLVGTYVQVDPRMAQIGGPRFDGHAAIKLSDGTRVSLLPLWHEGARRPLAETEAHDGKSVTVVAIVHATGPLDPRGGNSTTGPAVTDVEALYQAPPDQVDDDAK